MLVVIQQDVDSDIGSCCSGMGNLTGMASANGITGVGTLQILNNPYFTSFEDFSPAGPLAITAARNLNLKAATVAAFAEQQGTEETCVYPPNQTCTCLEWPGVPSVLKPG